MAMTEQCFIGVRHEGTPEGRVETIGGVPCYVAAPASSYDKEKIVLFLTDVFGLSPNNKLVVDDFARNGFWTVMPDYLEGDPYPSDYNREAGGFDRETWFQKHSFPHVKHLVEQIITKLKDQGVTRFGTTGYCFGGRVAFDLAFDSLAQVTIISHPGRIEVEDLEKYLSTSAPLLINSCEVDKPFDLDKQAKADEILGGGKFTPGYMRTYAEGCSHGFAVRADPNDEKAKIGKENAFKASVQWFRSHL